MHYNVNMIAEKVRIRKKKFLIRSAIFVSLLFACIAIMIFTDSDNLFFCSALAFAITVFLEFRTFKKFAPGVIFSREIKGENIKEHEISLSSAGGMRMSHRTVVMPNTSENRKPPRRRIRGSVYLKEENENIAEISNLSEQHMNFYEDGDILLKYAGTKFPIVISRPVDIQPCPICGRINRNTDNACRTCGLEITN